MKPLLLVALLLGAILLPARAQSDADDRYIGIANLMQRANQLTESGTPGEAMAAWTDAQIHLLQFQKTYPNWNPSIVSFRLNHINSQLAELKSQTPAAPVLPKVAAAPTASTALATPARAEQPATGELDQLRTQLQVERTANELLQAKLKEALAVRPAAVDPAELERAREKIRLLMKQNDLLMVSRGSVPVSQVQTVLVTNVVKVYVTNTAPVVVTNLAEAFKPAPAPVVVTNFVRVVAVDTNALEMLRLEHAAAVRNFNAEHARAEQLANDLHRLQTQTSAKPAPSAASRPATNEAAALTALRAENAALKAEVERLRAIPAPAAADTNLLTELKQARAQIAALQSEAQIIALEKLALQNKLQSLLAATNTTASAAAYEARIRELSLERNELIEKLDAANRQKSGKSGETAARLSDLNREVSLLRARLASVEAQATPYSAEELALFPKNTPPPAAPNAGKKSIKEMPAGTAALVYSAQEHFARREFDQAEADYLKILSRDQNNGLALANLAMIELQENRLDDAEKHINAALAQSPDDAYNLSTLGTLQYRQEKYSAAQASLGRAAQLEPRNPEIQNYLGLTLSHLGQRKAAETAFRKAIELNPKYAPAHGNLAVVYLTQTPAAPALARWHYQKTLDAGEPRNPEIEKLLAEKGVPYP